MDHVAFVDEGLGNSTYLVPIGDRRALVIDPPSSAGLTGGSVRPAAHSS